MQFLEESRSPVRPSAADRRVTAARRLVGSPPTLVMIGASTGGPQALIELLSALAPAIPYVSVAVTLHMPADLMPVIAAHVARSCNLPTLVVTEKASLSRGIVHFSPGDRHLSLAKAGQSLDVAPKASGTRHLCKPAVDTMFASGAAAEGSRALGVVLSGMGTDGLDGAQAIVASGGTVLVQSRDTSAVWGMPGVVAKAGLATAELPPAAIGKEVIWRLRLMEPKR